VKAASFLRFAQKSIDARLPFALFYDTIKSVILGSKYLYQWKRRK